MPSNDFSRRADLSEWMDQPCSRQDLQDCLRDLESVNHAVFAYRPLLNWLAKVITNQKRPVHIVDVGCGGGDTLRTIECWAAKRSIAVKLTGVDMNAETIRFAHVQTPTTSCIQYLHGNVIEHPDLRDVDLVISSHMTHHLGDDEIARFLCWMETTAHVGWFINDLHREPIPYYTFRFLAWCMRWHRFIRHDGPVSVLRSFQPDDWQGYLAKANIMEAEIRTFWPGRLCVQRRKRHAWIS